MVGLDFGDRIERGCSTVVLCIVVLVLHPVLWCGVILDFTPSPRIEYIKTTLTQRYISEVLYPILLPYFQGLPVTTFQLDNLRTQVAHNVQALFLDHHIPLLLWPTRSPELSPIEHVWSLIGERLARHAATAVITYELWLHMEAAWADNPQQHIQILFHSMSRSVVAVIDRC